MTLPSARGGSSITRRMAGAGGDALTLLGVVFAIPFVILAIGIPIALVVQLVLWVVRSL